MMRYTSLVVAGVLASTMLVGCTGKDEPQPSGSTAPQAEAVTPVWSVRTQAVAQPTLVDGLLVGGVVDLDSPVGESVVVWDAGTGAELWRHDGQDGTLFDVDSQPRVAYLVDRAGAWSVAVADVRTGEESLAAAPGGQQPDYLGTCDTTVCISIYNGDYASSWFRLDPASMTLAPSQSSSGATYPEGISMSYQSGAVVVSYEGDADHAAWTRPVTDMLGAGVSWYGAYSSAPWTWFGDREVLLGSTSVAPYDTQFDRSQEYATGGFAPDGTTLWNAYGSPCSSGKGGWTTGEIQVLCVGTGTATYTTVTKPGEFSIEPTVDDTGSYLVGIDVRTGEQTWRFPDEGTFRYVTGTNPFAQLVDDSEVLVRATDGTYLLDVATGNAHALDPDSVALCSQSVGQDTPPAGTVWRSVRRICGADGNPVVGPWPAQWIRLTGVSDGKGRYYVATASQLVAFDL